jgi:DNA-binding NarL/FixJ family response regulator
MSETDVRPPRVLILEKEDTIKGAVAARLESLGFAAETGEPGLEAEARASRGGFDAVVLAVEEMEPAHCEFIERLRATVSDGPEVVVLAEHATVPDSVKAMKLGAFDFMERPCRLRDIESAVREAIDQRRRRPSGRLEEALSDFASDTRLTRREIEIVRSLAEGLSNRVIADRLRITEHTVKTHLKNIFGKLNVRSRTEILSLVFQLLDRRHNGRR